eukprot:1185584-Prorocentrum_minimum.AAC.2
MTMWDTQRLVLFSQPRLRLPLLPLLSTTLIGRSDSGLPRPPAAGLPRPPAAGLPRPPATGLPIPSAALFDGDAAAVAATPSDAASAAPPPGVAGGVPKPAPKPAAPALGCVVPSARSQPFDSPVASFAAVRSSCSCLLRSNAACRIFCFFSAKASAFEGGVLEVPELSVWWGDLKGSPLARSLACSWSCAAWRISHASPIFNAAVRHRMTADTEW